MLYYLYIIIKYEMGNNNSTVALENLETRIYDCFVDLSKTMTIIKKWDTLITTECDEASNTRQQCIDCIKAAKETFDSRTNLISISDEHFKQFIGHLYSLPLNHDASKDRDNCVKLCRRITRYIEKYIALQQRVNASRSSNQPVQNNPHHLQEPQERVVTCDPVIEL